MSATLVVPFDDETGDLFGGDDAPLVAVAAQINQAHADAQTYASKAVERARTPSGPIPKAQWRRFAQLCHPDRHNNSVAATEAMKWLMEVRI